MTDDELAAIEHTPDVAALVAEVRRLKSELAHAGRPRYSGDASVVVDAIDAAFNRGVDAMREAAAKVAAECASERGHTQATMFATGRPDDAFVVGIKGGEASRIEALIRAIKVTP